MKTARIQNLIAPVLISALAFTTILAARAADSASAQATLGQGKKPNILILWGDDIGRWNISAYNHGQMGYQTPNIDRIARAMFTDWCGQGRPHPGLD